MKNRSVPIRIAAIIGTRPEAIKMAPVMRRLKQDNRFHATLISTSQHREMLAPFLELFKLQPDYDLDIMRDRQTLPGIAFRVIAGLEEIFQKIRPDLVLVQGDTASAMSAALTAFYMQVPVGHVEAGLRSLNRLDPFPEETNRTIISRVASLHFAPTEHNVQMLQQEGITHSLHQTGNTIVDALFDILAAIPDDIKALPAGEGLQGRKFILVTAHRRENHGFRMRQICSGLKMIATAYPEIRIIFPVHLNPSVRDTVFAELSDCANIILLDPIGYREFIALMQKSYFLISDSGGVQEEAPVLGKPVLVLRKNTERPEGVEAGAAKLIGTDPERIFFEAKQLLTDHGEYSRMASASHRELYGDGHAATRICEAIADYFP